MSVTNSQPLIGSKGRTLFLLSILFLISRLIILFSNFESVIYWEERYRGTIALEVLNGLKMPLFYYQYKPYEPGTMVIGLLSSPFFLIFGSSYISLKIVALMFSLGSFILWYLFLYKFFNLRVAILTSFLFILSPPNNIKFSLLSCGNHYETIFFTILSLFLFYNIFFTDDFKQRSHAIKFLLLGLISGFACYFSLTFFATLLTLAIFWFIFDKKLFLKSSFLIFIIPFLIGFSPWIYNTIFFKFGVFDFHGRPMYLVENSEAYVSKLFKMVVRGMPFSLGFGGIKGTTLDAYIYYLIALVSFAFLLRVNSNYLKKILFGIFPLKRFRTSPEELSKEVALVVFPILYCLLFTMSGFNVPDKILSDPFAFSPFDNFFYIDYRYFTLLFPFVFVFIALFSDRLWNSESQKNFKKGLSIFILIIVFSLCGLSYLKLIRPVDFGKGFLYSGSDYFILGEKIAGMYRKEPFEGLQLTEKLERQYRIVALRGFGHYLGRNTKFLKKIKDLNDRLKVPLYQGAAKGMFDSLILDKINLNLLKAENNQPIEISNIIEKVDEKYKNLFYRELGNLLKRDIKLRTDKEVDESLRLINHFSKGFQPQFQDLEIEYSDGGISFWVKKISQIPESYRGYFYKALGKGMGWLLWYHTDKFKKVVDMIPEEYKRDFYEGLGIGSGHLYSKNIKQAIKIVESLDSRYSFYHYQALGEALFWVCGYNLNKAVNLINLINEKDKGYCYEGLGSGIGYMLWWNPDKIKELLERIKEPYRPFCEKGIKRRIEEDFLLSKQNYFNYFRLKIRDFQEFSKRSWTCVLW